MKYSVVAILCCFLLLAVYKTDAQSYLRNTTEDKLCYRNFPLLFVLREPGELRQRSAVFRKLQERLQRDATLVIENCSKGACNCSILQFTDAEIADVGRQLKRMASTREMKSMIQTFKHFADYSLYNNDPDTAYIRKVWETDARGINHIISVYVEGNAPLYPKIDAMSFQKDDPVFRDSIGMSIKRTVSLGTFDIPFFKIPLQLALDALRLNGRDEAARYEPIKGGQNKAAFDAVGSTKFSAYPYGVILVPGLGPEQPGIALAPGGAKRCDSAAARYRAGMAPFIVVSGGHVHPNKTPYCEAVEMKKYLVDVLHVPDAAVIIEPYARHTTTNIRNTNRIIFRFKIPGSYPVLIVTDAAQNSYINGVLRDRLIKELGYVPCSSMKQLSAIETEYFPLENSTQVNSMEPLDP